MTETSAVVVLGSVITAIGIFIWRVFVWLTKDDGPIERLIDTHLEVVKSNAETGRKLVEAMEVDRQLHASHFAQQNQAAKDITRLLASGAVALDILADICDRLGVENGSKEALKTVRDELNRRAKNRS